MQVDRRSWLLKRAFPITVATLLTLTLLVVGLTYQASNRLLRENLNEKNQAALREIVGRVDTSMDVVDHLIVAVASDPDVRGYFSMNYLDLPSYLREASRVQSRLAAIRRTVPTLSSVILANYRHSELLSDSTAMPIADYPDRSLTSMVRRASVDGGVVGPRITRYPLGMQVVEEDVLFLVRPYPLGVSGELATGGVIAVMQVSELRRQVTRYANELGLAVTVRDETGSTVFEDLGASVDEGIAWVSEPVFSRRSGLEFVARSSPVSSEVGIRRFRTVIVAVAIGAVLLACLFALFLDRGLRRPWQDTVLAIAGEVEESTHPSEDAADRTAWSLPAIRREVLETIERARELEGRFESSRDVVLRQVLANRLLSPTNGQTDDSLFAQLGLEGTNHQVVLLDLGRPTSARSASARSGVSVGANEDELVSLAERSFGAVGNARAVHLPDGVLGVVLCPLDHMSAIRRSRSLVIALRTQGYPNAAAAVGDSHEGAGSIHSSYVEATFALEFRVVRPETPVISYADVSTHAAPLLPRDVSDRLRQLREAMHRRSAPALRQWAADFLAVAEESCRVPVALKHALARFVTDATDLAARMRIEAESPAPDFHHALWAGRNRAELEAIYGRAVDWFATALEQASTAGTGERRGREVVERVASLLFDPALSLTLVADSVGASNAHVSRLFRQATGQTFQEYVSRGRATEAERLLRESHYAVKEIACTVGYPEVHTLIRVFKKHYGVTPAEYRRGARIATTNPAR